MTVIVGSHLLENNLGELKVIIPSFRVLTITEVLQPKFIKKSLILTLYDTGNTKVKTEDLRLTV